MTRGLRAGALALCSSSGVATAGSGPWTLAPGDDNVYVGGDYYRFQEFRGGMSDDGQMLFSPITAYGLTGVWTTGLTTDVEFELKLGYESVRVNDPSDPSCTSENRPKDWCRTTSGLGDLGGQLKWRVVDELYASPLSASLSLGFRSGEAYAAHRRRLTTLGDGNTDVGGGVSVGRTDRLGRGWYQASVSGWYWYRFPNGTYDGQKAPANDVAYEAEATFGVLPRLGVGPAVYGFERLGGVNLDEVDFFDHDAWDRLDAAQVKVGAKVGVYGEQGGPTISLAVLRTVHARNNPLDTLAISLGVGYFRPAPVAAPDLGDDL